MPVLPKNINVKDVNPNNYKVRDIYPNNKAVNDVTPSNIYLSGETAVYLGTSMIPKGSPMGLLLSLTYWQDITDTIVRP